MDRMLEVKEPRLVTSILYYNVFMYMDDYGWPQLMLETKDGRLGYFMEWDPHKEKLVKAFDHMDLEEDHPLVYRTLEAFMKEDAWRR